MRRKTLSKDNVCVCVCVCVCYEEKMFPTDVVRVSGYSVLMSLATCMLFWQLFFYVTCFTPPTTNLEILTILMFDALLTCFSHG